MFVHPWNGRCWNKARSCMDEAKRELVQTWLAKAQHDLAAARKLSAEPDPYLDTAIYHCQQAAEKAVKGFLVFHDQDFEKTHNIRFLVELVASFTKRIKFCKDRRLNDYLWDHHRL